MTSRAMNVTVANWQDPENLQWSFAHMDELFPTDTLDAGDSLVLEFERKPLDIGEIEVSTFRGTMTVTEILESGRTDAWAVIQGETLVAESYANNMAHRS